MPCYYANMAPFHLGDDEGSDIDNGIHVLMMKTKMKISSLSSLFNDEKSFLFLTSFFVSGFREESCLTE